MSSLPKEIYDELSQVVGAEYISGDDSVTASHDWFGLGADPSPRTLLDKPPAVVVLPASTEEVSAVIKVCNRHGIGFKAHSTGYGNYAGVGTAGSVSIDLRRMNGLEIDAENRMAIIEPYVTAGELMAEAMKHNLMCHIIGAGPVHSPLASATSMAGVGLPGHHTGNNSRNLLSLEWVTPEGEIVRIGSSGSDCGWFTGEGPGPGFRGMIRGVLGALGGLGVFTRIGYKLYPWAGPQRLEWTGEHPQRGAVLPEHFSLHQLSWPNWEAMTKGTYDIKNSRIATLLTRTPPSGIGNILTATNREYFEAEEAGTLPEAATGATGKGWTVVLMAWTAKELAWKHAVLESILSATQGRQLSLDPLHEQIIFANAVTSLYVARFCRMGSAAGVSMGIFDSFGLIPKAIEHSEELLGDMQKPGGPMMKADTEQNWMWSSEGRHFWTENNPPANRFEPRSLASAVEFIVRSFIKGEKDPVGITFFLIGPAADMFGKKLGNAQVWMRKVKQMFDPKDLSDSNAFVRLKVSPEARAWPIVKNVLFHPKLKPLLQRILAKQFK